MVKLKKEPLRKKVVIIHGTKGSPEGNWFSWLGAELRKLGVSVIIPQLPTPENQTLSSWRTAFTDQVGALDAQSVVIGHSLGATFLLRLLEEASQPIAVSVFVAGLSGALGLPDYDFLNSTFVVEPFNWRKIRANAGRISCLAGDNDPYVPSSQGLEIATNLGVVLDQIPGGGHLNAEFGFTEFPYLWQSLNTLMR